MEDISKKLQLQMLDFNDERRKNWEINRNPYAAHVELTPKCNMKCIHCYLQHLHNDKEMSTQQILNIIDILYENNILFLTLTGGEIFTRSDFVEIYLYAKRKGFLVELFTNAFLITEDIINVLKQYPPLLIDVSLYGANESTYKTITGVSGAFEKVINNCKSLVSANIRVSLKSPILKETYDEMWEMKQIANEIGVPIVFSFEICASVDGDDTLKKHQVDIKRVLEYEFKEVSNNNTAYDDVTSKKRFLVENAEKLYHCKIGKNSFIVDYKGNMCPCMKFKHRGKKLDGHNFKDIWDDFGKYQKILISDKCKCKDCKLLYFCDACPAEMDFLFHDPEYRPAEFCDIAQTRYEFYVNHLSIDEVLKSI